MDGPLNSFTDTFFESIGSIHNVCSLVFTSKWLRKCPAFGGIFHDAWKAIKIKRHIWSSALIYFLLFFPLAGAPIDAGSTPRTAPSWAFSCNSWVTSEEMASLEALAVFISRILLPWNKPINEKKIITELYNMDPTSNSINRTFNNNRTSEIGNNMSKQLRWRTLWRFS